MPGRVFAPPRVARPERTVETRKAKKPKKRKVVAAWPSWQRFEEPAVT